MDYLTGKVRLRPQRITGKLILQVQESQVMVSDSLKSIYRVKVWRDATKNDQHKIALFRAKILDTQF
jgi:hypothetical protein